MANVRIIEQPEITTLSGNEYLVTDSPTAGTKKITPQNLVDAVGGGGSGVTDDLKVALLQIASKVAYIDDDGQEYYDDLYNALYDTTWQVTNTLTHCSSSNSAESVTKNGSYSATITASVGYTLTGATVSITMGGNDITSTAYSNGTISIASVTGALVISISAAAKTVSSISAVYTQSGTVYDTDSLDSLKADLVVTAVYTDSSTEVVPSTDYTLSGTLMAGTSTITVSYEEKTTTFSATVTAGFLYTPDKGILSDQSYINYTVITAQPAYTETITDGLLRMYCPALGSATGRFVYAFDPSTFATSCKLVTEFKIADMSWVASTNVHNGWAKFQLAKQGGTSTAAAAGFARNASTTGVLYLRYEVSNSPTKQEVSLNEWHTLEIECINNKQTIKLDNTVIANAVNSAGYAPSYGVINAYVFDCGNTNANDIYFRKIEFSYE